MPILNKRSFKIVITTGDTDGIGLEITRKALEFLDEQLDGPSQVHFKVICGEHVEWKPKKLNAVFEKGSSSPHDWVRVAGLSCLRGEFDALVTAPLSKMDFQQSGKPIGHTEIIKSLCPDSPIYPLFFGTQFHVGLVTSHISIGAIEESIHSKSLSSCFEACKSFLRTYCRPKNGVQFKVAILGLNPHSGDKGLIGLTEVNTIEPWIQNQSDPDFDLIGPLSPDSAFYPHAQRSVDLYLCMYHDQALIPFKLVHGIERGAQVTIGAPFLRTSVDHGTAKELYGKGTADHRGMLFAIDLASKLLEKKEKL